MARVLKWIRDLIVVNWSLKLLAITLGALSFYTIRGNISFEVPYTIPIEVQMGPGMAVLDKSMTAVDVTFRGSQEDLRRLDQAQIKAVVHPKETNPGGSEVVTIRPGNIVGANGVRVVMIRPGTIRLTYDREAERDVIVLRPKTVGAPLLGRVEVDYEPKVVRLRGPKRRLQNISAVSCEPVDVDGRVESFTRHARVLSPGDTWVYDIEPPEITVRVGIVTELVTREIEAVPVLAVTEPGTAVLVDLDPRVVNVVLQSRADVLESLAPDAVNVYVNCVGLTPGASYELPVHVYLPPEIDVRARVQPDSVRVQLTDQ